MLTFPCEAMAEFSTCFPVVYKQGTISTTYHVSRKGLLALVEDGCCMDKRRSTTGPLTEHLIVPRQLQLLTLLEVVEQVQQGQSTCIACGDVQLPLVHRRGRAVRTL